MQDEGTFVCPAGFLIQRPDRCQVKDIAICQVRLARVVVGVMGQSDDESDGVWFHEVAVRDGGEIVYFTAAAVRYRPISNPRRSALNSRSRLIPATCLVVAEADNSLVRLMGRGVVC